jgi:putative ABC transport system permease protein
MQMRRYAMKKDFIEKIENNPVIAAVKDDKGLAKALTTECEIIFILYGDICSIADIVKKIKSAGKVAMVHMDLITGLGSGKDVAVDFIKNNIQADGIITTKGSLIERANELGLYTVLRYFVIDSMALVNIEKQDKHGIAQPDVIEILPGIIQPKKDASNATLSTCICYTSKLTDYIIKRTDETDIIKEQEANPDINVLTGMKFEAADDEEKATLAKEYISKMGISEKANFYRAAMNSMAQQTGQDVSMYQNLDETTLANMLTQWLNSNPDKDMLISVYNQYIGGSTYADNMDAFGKVSYDAPESISIYTDSFEDKDAVADCIEDYNKKASKEQKITYTDYVKLMTSSLTSIVNVISYVLIAFVAVSLVVSCIMIGIITHISVLERTKEIGILRALGASKRNVSQVFNAETIIIGFASGILGIFISWLLCFPINSVISKAVGDGVNVHIPADSAVFLIILSVVITVIGGLMPAKSAAKKDPVVALRTE